MEEGTGLTSITSTETSFSQEALLTDQPQYKPLWGVGAKAEVGTLRKCDLGGPLILPES